MCLASYTGGMVMVMRDASGDVVAIIPSSAYSYLRRICLAVPSTFSPQVSHFMIRILSQHMYPPPPLAFVEHPHAHPQFSG